MIDNTNAVCYYALTMFSCINNEVVGECSDRDERKTSWAFWLIFIILLQKNAINGEIMKRRRFSIDKKPHNKCIQSIRWWWKISMEEKKILWVGFSFLLVFVVVSYARSLCILNNRDGKLWTKCWFSFPSSMLKVNGGKWMFLIRRCISWD